MEMVLAQIIMVLTLVIMIAGWAPLYITAAIGATFSAVAAGFPLTGSEPVTIQKLLIASILWILAAVMAVLRALQLQPVWQRHFWVR